MTTYDVVSMTPDLAADWLGHPWTRQRRVSARTVERYAAAMREGRWMEPSLDPIALTADDHLLNGQHRLSAVIAAEWTGEMLVARGVDPAIFPVIDTGRHRLASQFVNGPQSQAVTSVARMALWAAERWPLHPRGRALSFDNDRLLTYIDAHEADLLAAVRDTDRMRYGGVPGKTAAAVVYLARLLDADEDRLSAWIDGVAYGADLGPDDPRLTLRNRLTAPGVVALKRDNAAVWMLTVRAFNAYWQGRTMAYVMFEPKARPPVIDLTGREVANAQQRAHTARRKVMTAAKIITPKPAKMAAEGR